jgi:hypothetical protein
VFDLTTTNNVFDVTTTNDVFDLTTTNNVFDLTTTNNVFDVPMRHQRQLVDTDNIKFEIKKENDNIIL